MNIVIGKFGKSVLFNENMWKHEGGDAEAPMFYSCISKFNPDIKFYMIGKSDLYRLTPAQMTKYFPNNNVIDIWKGFDETKHDKITWCTNKLKDVNIDAGVLFGGPNGGVNIPNKIKTIRNSKEGQIAKVLEMFENYAGPMIHYLNDSNIPYFNICTDSRYHPIYARDLINCEKFAFGQANYIKEKKNIISYEDQDLVFTKIPMFYSNIETLFLYGKTRRNISKKNIKFSILMNQIIKDPFNKLDFLEKYILNNKLLSKEFRDNVSIYGEWQQEVFDKYPQFKGKLAYSKIYDYMSNVKYTLINTINNWVTAKYWECIYTGTIPFVGKEFHNQNYIKIPDIIKVNSPEEFAEKINIFESDENLYINTLEQLNAQLREDYFNGRFINNLFKHGIKRITNITINSLEEANNKKFGFSKFLEK